MKSNFNAFELNELSEIISIYNILSNNTKYIQLNNLLRRQDKSIFNYCLKNKDSLKMDLVDWLDNSKSGLFQLYVNTNYNDLYDLKCKYLDKIDIELFTNILSIKPFNFLNKKEINKYTKKFEEFKKLDDYEKLIFIARNKRY